MPVRGSKLAGEKLFGEERNRLEPDFPPVFHSPSNALRSLDFVLSNLKGFAGETMFEEISTVNVRVQPFVSGWFERRKKFPVTFDFRSSLFHKLLLGHL